MGIGVPERSRRTPVSGRRRWGIREERLSSIFHREPERAPLDSRLLEGRRAAAKSGLDARLRRGGRCTLGAATFVYEQGLVVGVALKNSHKIDCEGGESWEGANPHWSKLVNLPSSTPRFLVPHAQILLPYRERVCVCGRES